MSEIQGRTYVLLSELSSEKMMANAWIILALLCGMLLYGLAMGTTYPLLGIVLAGQTGSLWNGINAAATGLGLLLGVALVPALSRNLSAGWTILIGVGLMAASLAALAVTQNFWLIFVVRLVLGCGANLLFVIGETALNTFAGAERRGRIMGAYTATVALGFVVGPAVVAASSDAPAVLLLLCSATAALAFLPLRLAQAAIAASVQPASASRILPTAALYPFAFAFLLVASAVDAVVISLLPVISLGHSFSIKAGALFVTVFHVGLLIGQPLVGVALDWTGRRRTVLGCCLLAFACAAALGFGERLGFWPVCLLMFVWGGANYGLYTAGLALIGDRFAEDELTAATAAFAAVYAVASILSPALAGTAVDQLGTSGLYAVVAGLYCLALAAGAALFRPAEPSLAPERTAQSQRRK